MKHLKLITLSSAIVLMTACASTPDNANLVEDVRSEYEQLSSRTDYNKHAPIALKDALEEIKKAEKLVEESASEKKIKRQAYLAELKLKYAQELVRKGEAQKTIADAESSRKDILLKARTNEAQMAQAKAALASSRANAMEQRAETAEQRASRLANKAQKLESEIDEITTKKTDRGLVLTLDNILFETGKAQLLQGSQRSISRVSEFLNNYPDRNITIEGHTDSRGSDTLNQQLSKRRADAVRMALLEQGISSSRVAAKGLGEQYPVATNDTREGRLQNRRVDIIIENADNMQTSNN